jgi:hypothetical protein
MDRMRWVVVGALCAGCLGPSSRPCSSGADTWSCPEDKACAEPPTYCGSPALVGACDGKQKFDACAFTASEAGACVGGVCTECTMDLEGCHYPGWVPMASNVGTDLRAVWAAGAGDAHAGGSALLHYDGTAWSPETFPTIPPAAYISALWGSAHDDVYAAVTNGSVLHFDGTTWTQATLSPQSANGVGGVAEHVVVCGVNGTVDEYVAGTWTVTQQVLGMPAILNAVWGNDADDIFVVGNVGLVLRYHQGAWQTSRAPSGPRLNAVWGRAGDDVYAVGDQAGTSTIYHYDGATWNPESLPQAVNLYGVWGDADHVYAVGPSGSIFERTSGTWAAVTSPATQTLYAISGAGDVYAVGGLGQIVRLTN